jgi:hypothetical protein
VFSDLDDSLNLDDPGDYDPEFEEDEDDPEQSFDGDIWAPFRESPAYQNASEDTTLAQQQEQQRMESRHPLETVLRNQTVDDSDIRIDDALSFVSNLICGTNQRNPAGPGGSSSSRCSSSSSGLRVGRSPRRVANTGGSMNSGRSPLREPSG